MHAFLITGGSEEEKNKKELMLLEGWNAGAFDIFRLDVEENKQSIGIAEIRLLTHNLTLAPRQSPVVVGIIKQSDHLTTEAQNALLKTLEEPPIKARLILKTDNASLLLPTIVSRCHVIQLTTKSKITDEDRKKIQDILTSCMGKTKGELCQCVDQNFSKKEEGIAFLHTLLFLLHEDLIHPPHTTHQFVPVSWNSRHRNYVIRAVLKAQNQLSANVHFTAVLDTFFIKSLALQV